LRVELEIMAVNSPDDFEAEFRRVQGVGALIQIDDGEQPGRKGKPKRLGAR
jgi:hypothetical protein